VILIFKSPFACGIFHCAINQFALDQEVTFCASSQLSRRLKVSKAAIIAAMKSGLYFVTPLCSSRKIVLRHIDANKCHCHKTGETFLEKFHFFPKHKIQTLFISKTKLSSILILLILATTAFLLNGSRVSRAARGLAPFACPLLPTLDQGERIAFL